MRILVTGGSGVLGSQVVERLRAAGEQAVVLSRRPGPSPDWMQGDIATGEGLEVALEGSEVVVHAASAAAEFTKIKKTDIDGTRRLVQGAAAAGVKHLVNISIVGIDRIDYGYYNAKLAAEEMIRGAGLPWSILRATQFHELIDRGARALARGPFLFVPRGFSFQPVDSAEVAERLTEMATGSPTQLVEEYGGPEVLTTRELAIAWLGRRSQHRRVVAIPVPGKAGPGFRAGHHLCPDQRQGKQTWSQWLERAYASGRVPQAYSRRSAAD